MHGIYALLIALSSCCAVSMCIPAAWAQAEALDLLENGGDINQVFIIVQEEPLAETGNPAGNLAGRRLSQEQVEGMGLEEMLADGKRLYTTPFTLADGYGDGPTDPVEDYRVDGGRAGLQKAYPVMRINGLDAQTCLECHIVMRNSSIPPVAGIGGAVGVSGNVLFRPGYFDLEDSPTSFNGRFINPLNNAGLGGIELLAKEMTMDLQEHMARAMEQPGQAVRLVTHGVDFGSLVHTGSVFDYSGVRGVDEDLVVRPFGRKGEFATVRDFDVTAMSFHFGMQAAEVYGADVDGDGDGVVNEISDGELSAMHVFLTNLPAPFVDSAVDPGRLDQGLETFRSTGCADCHKPVLYTRSRDLTYSFPEEPNDPLANVYMSVDLSETAGYRPHGSGLAVPLFSDLMRHNMGEGLSESLDLPDLEDAEKFNREFRTAGLAGVRDTAPYLHDGRAQSIPEAILAHGGEAKYARDVFAGLPADRQEQILYLLGSLRNPLIR